jgi:hypothetical protein
MLFEILFLYFAQSDMSLSYKEFFWGEGGLYCLYSMHKESYIDDIDVPVCLK